ncbi:MAG: hypothetical protein D6763_01280 [Alphaproteobacteria bacterium]|nr:MAG: hypothetical protein D6763_01280 [Alphaproteobacteria bacterium]
MWFSGHGIDVFRAVGKAEIMGSVAQKKPEITLEHALESVGARIGDAAFASPAHFTFRWAGLRFQGRLQTLAPDQNELEVTARLGILPFSAENQAARRDALKELARHLSGVEGTYRVTGRGEIQCVATTTFSGPIRAPDIAHCLTISLLHLRKLMDRFRAFLIPLA